MGKKGKKEPSKQKITNVVKKNSFNLMKLNHVVANGWVTFFLILLMDIAIVLLFNYALNVLVQLPKYLKSSVTGNVNQTIKYGLSNFGFNQNILTKFSVIYIIGVVFLIVIDIKIAYQIQTAYRDFNKDQKNSMRWTTIKEIQEQYKCIPDKGKTVTERFKGNGGVPVCHYENNFYIDNSGVHSLILGITRSGKGEMFVTTMLDIYSRAEKQASMIINDPKLELCAMSYDTLEKRGYDVHVLNLIEPVNSMGYNPLSLITDAYKSGDMEGAEMLASTFCYSIFNSEDSNNGENQYFSDNATFCLSAFIFAMIEDCLEEDKELNKIKKAEWEGATKAYQELDPESQAKMNQKLTRISELEAIKDQTKELVEYKRIKAEIEELKQETKGYTNKEFVPTEENEKRITMTSIINTMSELSRMKMDDEGSTTMIDYYFNTRPPMNRAKILFSCIEIAGGQKTKGAIYSTMLSKLILFTYSSISKLTAETTVSMESIGFGEKPVAVFMGTPDYDHSKDFIATVFVRQASYVLSKKATLTPSGKCLREVIFHLDEFGSMPKIEGFDSAITVALGRGIRYNLIIQSYAQIESTYKDESKTIIGNCGNQIYIQSADIDSAEHFAKMVGSETITTINRSGNKMALNKTYTEMLEDRALINANELMSMTEGENVIKRVMKRTDLKGRDIKPYAIWNKKETGTDMPYRYMFLEEYFPSGKLISEVTKETRAHIDGNNVYDIQTKVKKILANAENNQENGNPQLARKQEYDRIKNIEVRQIEKSDSAIADFYHKVIEPLNVEWGEVIECTVEDIYVYLSQQDSLKARAWYNFVTDDAIKTQTPKAPDPESEELTPDPTDEGVQAIQKAIEKQKQYKKKITSEEELEAQATDLDEEELEEVDIEDRLISSFKNRLEVVRFIWDNADSDMMEDEEITEDIDILELTVAEAKEILVTESVQYLDTILERGING